MNGDEEVKLSGEAAKGSRAHALLESDIFKEAFDIVEQDTIAKWKASPVRDTEGQLALRLKMQVLMEVRALIADVAMTGRLASKTLADEMQRRTLAERAKAAVREFKR